MADFDGKVAVVLGASAEGGTGWAIAEALAAHGAKVVVGARSYEPLKVLADRINGTAVRCDAGDEDHVAALAEAALKTYGKLDIAVNSAGQPITGMIADITTEQLQAGVRGNYFSHVYFVKHMAKAIGSNGSIVIISSIAATQVQSWFFAYSCAKAAANCLVRYAALEYGARNIRVNAISPGPIASNLAQGVLLKPGVHDALIRNIPLKRIADPADIANAVLWLAGPAYATGLDLQVNGGFQLGRFPFEDELPGGYACFGPSQALFDREQGNSR